MVNPHALIREPHTLTVHDIPHRPMLLYPRRRSVTSGVENVIVSTDYGTTQRSTAFLLNDRELRGYRVEINTDSPGGRNISLVDSRRLEGQGHANIEVCSPPESTVTSRVYTESWNRFAC